MVVNLTDDLDLISEKLFSLTTDGGEEFCGQAIKRSIDQLSWGSSNADLKVIFIAGNESFDQGGIAYESACKQARAKGVFVNTVYCGSKLEGINSFWQKGAQLTGGAYMNIEQNNETVFMVTPYDQKLGALNKELNNTYYYYGDVGKEKRSLQLKQDALASSYGYSNTVERTISKSSGLYSNKSWDLVDAYKDDATILDKVKIETLPDTLKNLNTEQRKNFVLAETEKRDSIQKQIREIGTMRSTYMAKQATKTDGMLDEALIKAIKEMAKSKQMKFEE